MTRWEIRRLSAVRRRPLAWKPARGAGPPSRTPDASDRRASPLALADTAMSVV
ncbi:hypothetical protein OG241_16260 [Streptomyces sp. NBC_01390]|uniref:hypothetical protein n=1 Tax=unclassified Streptomyces TaxID=2593676 RepID=UPI0029A73583|nr:hypothetical protein [Streptomyces sp. AK08-02]MDX3749169.1 hypothetical protein [Streptomyces sp. AK08-02]